MRSDEVLRPNREEVAAKVIDGEAVLINLLTGTYYGMNPSGALVWQWIEAGQPIDRIGAALAARYEVTAEQARADVEAFAAELLRENLVKRSAEPAGPSPPVPDSGAPLPYEPPRLDAYRDMEDLLALDPPMPGQEVAWDESE